jgi:hypothetical protein
MTDREMTDRERLIELMQDWGTENTDSFPFESVADYLLANGDIVVPPCKVGGEIWVVEYEDDDPVDVSCVQFLAKASNCVIATAFINDYDIDETLNCHIDETQERFDTDLKVYHEYDCYLTKEEAGGQRERD